MKLAGCIVLYNSNNDVWTNINSYLKDVDKLYVLDNSEVYHTELIEHIKKSSKCEYINLHGNRGISVALNLAVKKARKDGFKWLLTMDQDSFFSGDNIEILKSYIEFEKPDIVKVVCPCFENEKIKTKKYVLEMITSGSIMDVEYCTKIGGFDNKLFIDEVDHDYCARVVLDGKKVIKLNQAKLNHCLGNQTYHKKIKCYNYPPIRYYYITRNNLYFYYKYKKCKSIEPVVKVKLPRIKNFVISIWFEENRLKKYFYMFLGLLDFWTGRMGKNRWFQKKG